MKQINNSFLEVKKSRFYGYLYEINSIEEVQEILDETKKNNKKCKHIVYSYILNSCEKLFTDKEPSGSTIGLLNTLKRNNLNSHLIIVVRYFGGTLLGSGPLTRTYSKVSNNLVK